MHPIPREKRETRPHQRLAGINGVSQMKYCSTTPHGLNLCFPQGHLDATEGRGDTFTDLPGAFLHILTSEKSTVILTGELCDLMASVDPPLC